MGKKNTCCFTGHRPQKLPWGYDEEWEDCVKLKLKLACEIEAMRKKGVTTFISGMAVGVDMWAAEIVLDLKSAYPQDTIKLIAAIPYEGQANKWSVEYRERYFDILAQADQEVIFQEHYTKSCMHERNRFMVDNSAYMIAVFNGDKGGTANTLHYAESKGLNIVIINPNALSRDEKPLYRGLKLLK
jgi:uncharacterized phage-like protein YoqJ